MWSYYGSKSRVVNSYPAPIFDKIIEPFAGSARYSLKYFDRDITLIDKYLKVVNVWHYLQRCSVKDIMSLPVLPAYSKISETDFDDLGQFELMQFLIVQGAYNGNRTVSKWGAMRFEKSRKNVADSLYKIKHWKIISGDYTVAENISCTWFIDPPYQFGGHKYPMSNKKIDFNHLSNWIKTRQGQIIACENTKADWMKFNPMKSQQGVKYKTTEAIYSNLPTAFDFQQQNMFT